MKNNILNKFNFSGNWKDHINSVNVVYKITNLIKNKIYIGISKNLKHRLYGYLKEINNPTRPISKSLAKYGSQNFQFDVIHIFNSYDECINIEPVLIKELINSKQKIYNVSFNKLVKKMILELKIIMRS
ncbi:MAG: GIY-YIG nuclease family protein [Chitinophagales bacterium]|nr:GIY-YIG nuclease family protein [Chitinophagales bacterium]